MKLVKNTMSPFEMAGTLDDGDLLYMATMPLEMGLGSVPEAPITLRMLLKPKTKALLLLNWA